MHQFSTARGGFTLLEMIVVVVILVVLLALIMPALSSARDDAITVTCNSNLRQCGTVLATYGVDHDNALPPAAPAPRLPATVFLYQQGPDRGDLRRALYGYMSKFDVWMCPALESAPPIDDASNTRNICFGTYAYWPGRTSPSFGSAGAVPAGFLDADRPSGTPMMQDTYADATSPGLKWYNHGEGELQSTLAANPSNQVIRGDTGQGANILFYDGHAVWHHADQLQNVGYWSERLGVDAYSVMP